MIDLYVIAIKWVHYADQWRAGISWSVLISMGCVGESVVVDRGFVCMYAVSLCENSSRDDVV